ncbi:2OG-Fe(II) oxygenase [Simiduia sp. 21SJ11W-1]|uniref:prolyl hydroxylase family protein n=1 Tax=Simiduia sp. 21SJ11W-1 TaxID=2909669 RepID=UPI0020A168B5|nr:2OG-Fe(II) oxygenase [Simiduia sp. 21SJ11W-1]UTA47118.1 2OG-Fe(II) oxygenase [Simiduia sp. 21SJ11W-1]
MDAQWLEWTRHNVARGCDVQELQAILARAGFAACEITEALTLAGAPLASTATADAEVDYVALSRPSLVANPQAVGASPIDDTRVQLYQIPDFLDAARCEAIMALMDAWLRPSTVTTGSLYAGFRTSQTCDLGQMNDPLVAEVDARIAQTLGINPAWGEATQGQKYQVGEEFKAHTDYFQPATPEYAKFAGARGQRSWTFMIYLNNTPAGGATHFTRLERSFYPRQGSALIWNNLQPTGAPNPLTEHHGMPVVEGTKSIITKWFRDRGPGAMADTLGTGTQG